ncbi:MAG: WGR domain-containing protein [Oculatellaceae cyanobacterium Prado106]|jgi:predicted DNA-binding WGR domain protein|nr:WGR domain-containing protein [Oculatellaceae cyanobacterium Prado106]
MVTKPDVSQAVRTAKLICVDTSQNHNKQWVAWVMPNGDLYVEYGRVGYTQQSRLHSYRSVSAAENRLTQLMREKLGKGYQPALVEDTPGEQLDFSLLKADEADFIRRRLQRLQGHAETIAQFVRLSFDINRGVFRTALGVLSQEAIAQARQRLRQVENCVRQGRLRQNPQFGVAVAQYLEVIPLKVGMNLDPYLLLGQPEQVQSQNALLGELEWVLAEVQEIRLLIQEAIAQDAASGSDERARWINWGAVQGENATL